jgi:hypothetical protein
MKKIIIISLLALPLVACQVNKQGATLGIPDANLIDVDLNPVSAQLKSPTVSVSGKVDQLGLSIKDGLKVKVPFVSVGVPYPKASIGSKE